ncbi:MAG TPA: serpin family protein [Pirellulaceae bacterium]|nr:serpin family protein [Pirellulaceae bacterium]
MSIARSVCAALVAVGVVSLLAGQKVVAGETPFGTERMAATHLIAADTPYYKSGPQQGRPADGTLKAGTRVQLVKAAGSFSQVKADSGVVAYVAAQSLTPVLSKEAITPDVKNIATSINGFAFDLYREVGKQEGNLFVSPASISTALAMTYAGANGQTEKEMAHVLHFDRIPTQLPVERFHEAYGKLTTLLNSGGGQGGYVLSTANRLWGQESYEFRPAFLKITREHYGAELAELDFRRTEAARTTINEWARQQTRNKIQDLIPSGVLTSDTRLVLTNAIYFLGGWAKEFSPAATKNQPFFVKPGESVEVPLMTQKRSFQYAETDDAQLLALPYRGFEISMLVLLPKERGGLERLESQLTADKVEAWLAPARPREVEVYLPKFKLTTEVSLKETLSALGMPTAFGEAADFSKMASGEQLFISEVLHKAFVDVNEKGTEAAAATAVGVAAAAFVEPPQPVVFRADHPFVFLLRDNRSGNILFLGRVSDPR